VWIRALGPLLVGEPPTTLSRRDRVVLAALASRPGAACSPDDLADALWPVRRPPTWTKVIQGAVVRLRRALGRGAIDRVPDGYRLTLDVDEIDVAVFEGLLARGRRLADLGEPARAIAAYDDALGLWRGRPFPDLDDWPAGREEVARLESLLAELEEDRLAVAVSTGRAQDLLPLAQRLVHESPYRERRWELLALALYAADRQAEALDAIARAKRTLRDDLGLQPGGRLLELEQAILGHDPALPRGRAPRASDVCPYQGLTAFQPEHQDLFVGRESDVVACLRRLDEHPLLLVVGSSGSGKSSLVRAGIVPALRRGDRQVVVVVPSRDPVDELRSERATTGAGAVLFVDQLEELAGADPGEQTAYLELVADWARTGKVILTLRSDRLDVLTASPRLAKLANRGLYLLTPLGGPELRRVVVEPADRVGLLVEPGLVDVLLRDVGDRPGALPLLSHALRQTWLHREGDMLTVDGYTATGGIAGAVAQTADNVWTELDTDHQRALRSLLLRLVSITPEGAPVGTRLTTGPRTDPGLLLVIERLAMHRLVTVEDGSVALSHEAIAQAWPRLRTWLDDDVRGRQVLDHLTMAAAGWSSTGRPVAELYRGARLAAALEWRESSTPALTADEEDFLDASALHDADEGRAEREALRDQRRRNRRLRGLLTAVAGLLVVALAAGAVALSSRRDADRAAREVAAARLSDLAVREPRADTALLAARQAVELARTPQTSADLLRAVDERADIRTVRDAGVEGFLGAQTQLSPDGSRLLTLQMDGVHLVEPATGEHVSGGPVVPGEVRAGLYAVGFVEDGRIALVTAGVGAEGSERACELRRLDSVTGTPVGPAEALPGSTCGDFFVMDRMRASPDGTVLVSMVEDTLRWWRWEANRWTGPRTVRVASVDEGTPLPQSITISDDGRAAVVLVEVGQAAPWYRYHHVPVVVDLVAAQVLGPVVRGPVVSTAAISPDGARVAVGGFDGSVSVRPLAGAGESVLSTGGQAPVSTLAWSQDGEALHVGRGDGRVDVVRVATASVDRSLVGHAVAVTALREVELDDGPGLVSLDQSGVLIVRTLGPSTALGARRTVNRPHAVAILPTGGEVLVGEEGGVVAVYGRTDLDRSGELVLEVGRLKAPAVAAAARRRVSALAVTADGRSVVAGDRTGRLTAWSWPDRRVRWTRDDAPAAFLGISPDGRSLVTAEFTHMEGDVAPDSHPASSRIRLWDMASGEMLAEVDADARKPRAVAMSPDSTTAVVAFFDGGLDVVDLAARRVVHRIDGGAAALAFTPDGARLVVIGFEGQGRVFSTDTWEQEDAFDSLATGYAHVLPEPTGRLTFVASSRDVAVWDAAAMRRLAPRLSVRGDDTNDALFLAQASDEPVMVVASQTEVALVDLRESVWREAACRIAARQLTEAEWNRLLSDMEYTPSCGEPLFAGAPRD
jgi:DNA-binding SARP family transcriptional activator/WD40 repeat protein